MPATLRPWFSMKLDPSLLYCGESTALSLLRTRRLHGFTAVRFGCQEQKTHLGAVLLGLVTTPSALRVWRDSAKLLNVSLRSEPLNPGLTVLPSHSDPAETPSPRLQLGSAFSILEPVRWPYTWLHSQCMKKQELFQIKCFYEKGLITCKKGRFTNKII